MLNSILRLEGFLPAAVQYIKCRMKTSQTLSCLDYHKVLYGKEELGSFFFFFMWFFFIIQKIFWGLYIGLYHLIRNIWSLLLIDIGLSVYMLISMSLNNFLSMCSEIFFEVLHTVRALCLKECQYFTVLKWVNFTPILTQNLALFFLGIHWIFIFETFPNVRLLWLENRSKLVPRPPWYVLGVNPKCFSEISWEDEIFKK